MGRVLMTEDVMKILPQRYPFLLVDRVTIIEEKKEAEGIKNYTINELFFTGHFPGRPIVPGVLLVESLAQLTAVLYCSDIISENVSDHVGYMAKINDFKFKKLVTPGDQLFLHSRIIEEFGNIVKAKVSACIKDGDKKINIVEGTITVTKK